MNHSPRRGRPIFRVLAPVCAAAVALTVFAQLGVASSTAAPSNTLRPTIAGNARVGNTLTANRGRWNNTPTGFAFQWLRCGPAGANCAAISGATNQSYTLTSSDLTHRIRVRVTASNKDGSSSADSNPTATVLAAGTGPVSRSAPGISGTPKVGQALTASNGTWSGASRFAYQWQRCDETGGACVDIAGATTQTYTLQAADSAHRIRVRVTASNARGSSSAMSNATDLVAPASGTGGPAISVASVVPPQRLIIDQVKSVPTIVRSRKPFVVRFHVSDTRGFAVREALVYVLPLPYGLIRNAPEVQTDGTGWAAIQLAPTSKLPLRAGSLVMFVRARKSGENLLAGISTRRLVQIRTGSPG
jgi:hypothetical protein